MSMRVVQLKIDRNRDFPRDNKVPAIKLIRNLSGMGLKEAKDVTEVVQDASQDIITFDVVSCLDKITIQNMLKDLESLINVEATIRGSRSIESLKSLAREAINNEEYDIAGDVIELLRKYS